MQSPKTQFSLIFQKPKTIKFGSLKHKTLFKNTSENWNFFSQKSWPKSPKRWGLYRPIRKLAVRLMWQPDRLDGRPPGRPPTVKNVTVRQTRSTARSTQTNRELCSQTRSTGPVPARRAQVCARRSTHGVDRPMVRSTVRVDRPGLSAQTWVRTNMLKIF